MKKAIGIDLGGTNVRAALIGSDGSVIRRLKEPTTENIFDTLRAMVNELSTDGVEGIGVGAAGLVDKKERRVILSPNIPSITGKGFDEIGDGLKVYLENDANAAALGERWLGAGKNFESFVLMTLGTGIGGGFIHKGRLLNVSAEVGHMSVEQAGRKCLCGGSGCLELYASARAITEAVTKAIEGGAESILTQGNIYKLTPEDVYKAAFEGDNLARESLREAGRYLGIGIANLINIISPDAVVLAGGLTGAWDLYIKEAIKEAQKRAFKSLFDKASIVQASLNDDAGVLGAAYLVFHGEQSYIC